MITISSYYGDSASAKNNAKMIKLNGMTFYFSYETLVAVHTGKELKVVQNQWGPTTGKHLNKIDGGDKTHRLEKHKFDEFVQTISMDAMVCA